MIILIIIKIIIILIIIIKIMIILIIIIKIIIILIIIIKTIIISTSLENDPNMRLQQCGGDLMPSIEFGKQLFQSNGDDGEILPLHYITIHYIALHYIVLHW